MNNFKGYLGIALAALLLLLSGAQASGTAARKKIRILGVGNSFTANSTKFLTSIINSDKDIDADIGVAYKGGCPLDLHVNSAKAHEANPKDPKGKIYNYILNRKTVKTKVSLKEMLQDGKWDYITIQQVSHKSYKPETFYPYAKELYDYIKKYCPDAKIVIHETWSHRIDCPRTKQWKMHPDEMYKKLHANYAKISKELNAPVIPVGTSFQNAKKRPMWNYVPQKGFNPKALKYPAKLPDQSKSLHNGYYWHTDKKKKKTVRMDGFHAGKSGEYLGGCVWYQFFFNKDPRKLTYKPKGMSEEQAKSLREVAYETINQEQASASN